MTHYPLPSSALGVGILGAGPVTQAIHLPVLATMPELFRIVQIMDIDPTVASVVAARCGATASTNEDAVLSDPAVEVVAICSPNAFHAPQILAACAAGKKAIMCEKPLAVSVTEAAAIRDAIERHGVSLLVGTMHAFDPAYRAAHALWGEIGETPRLIQSSIYLPGNDAFIDQATNQVTSANVTPRGKAGSPLEVRQRMFSGAMLGLAIHNVPLVRDFMPTVGTLAQARFLEPFGYSVVLRRESTTATLNALMPGNWPPKWQFTVHGNGALLEVDFPPSYVLAGSARARLRGPDTDRNFTFSENGYQAQWRHLHEMVGGREPIVPIEIALGDLDFALALAAQGSAALGESVQ